MILFSIRNGKFGEQSDEKQEKAPRLCPAKGKHAML